MRAVSNYLDIDELFSDWNHINYYFVCELIEDTGVQHLTEAEKRAGYIIEWVLLDDITSRAMMGEYIIYYRGKVVGGIYDDRFLVKPTKSSVAMKRIQPMNR